MVGGRAGLGRGQRDGSPRRRRTPPIFEAYGGRKGRLSVQANPATAAGIAGTEEATALGVNTSATVSFTVSQALAAAEAAERGLRRREAAGGDTSTMDPIVVLTIGRLDDWMKVLVERDGLAVNPAAPNWAGIAVLKRTYAIFRERGYRSRLLVAAYRHPLHWTELVGGKVAMTITPSWQERFERSGIVPKPRIGVPVDPAIVTCRRRARHRGPG